MPKMSNKIIAKFEKKYHLKIDKVTKELTIEQKKKMIYQINNETNQKLLLIKDKKRLKYIIKKIAEVSMKFEVQGEPLIAIEKLKNIILIVEKRLIDEKKLLSILYSNLGSLYISSFDLAKAISLLKKSIKMNSKFIPAYSNLGSAYEYLGDYDLALRNYHKSLNLIKKSPLRKEQLSLIYSSIANIYSQKKDYNNSLKYSQTALLFRKNPWNRKDIYVNLALSYTKLGKYEKALYYTELLGKRLKEQFRKESIYTASYFTLLGEVYTDYKKYDKALKYLMKSLKLSEDSKYEISDYRREIVFSNKYKRISLVYYQMKKFEKSYFYINKAFKLFLRTKSYYFSTLNQFHKKKFIQRNNEFISALLKISYQANTDNEKTFNRWLNYKRAIFDISNSFKLLYIQTKEQKVKNQIEKLLYLERKLAQLYQFKLKESEPKIVKIKKEISKLEASLSSYIPAINKEISYKDITTYLKADELYIDIANIEESYYLFTLNKKGKIEFNKLDAFSINSIIKNIQTENQNIIEGTTFANIKKAKEQYGKLYDLIFSQIDINNKKSLIISLDGLLSLIPFEAFYDKKEKKYLIEKVKINYIPSGKELVNLYKKSEVSNNKVVVFANPDFGLNSSKEMSKFRRGTVEALYEQAKGQNSLNQLFKPLNGTQKEALAIKKLYPNSQIYKDKEASEANFFKISQPKILHLSTHGFFLKDEKVINPMLKSGIALSGANYAIKNQNGEGIVTALEISGLNLNGTELVVLSACETGVGEVEEAEGVAGINKAFMKAGARYIVMSLWSVSDNATAILMKKFYGNIKENSSYGIALREAKIEMIKNGKAHPYYWSGFVGSGVDR
jgi:CHAT domain-containing protein/Tfp pilus assembly protein PilF